MEIILIVILIMTAYLIYLMISLGKRREAYKRRRIEGVNGSLNSSRTKSSHKKWFDQLLKLPASKDQTALVHDDEAVAWCANLLGVKDENLKKILRNIPSHYHVFWMGKRNGGYRVISSPDQELKSIQDAIYHRILLSVNVHPAATGFSPRRSIADNARPHLGRKQILKTDIHRFFDSIRGPMVRGAFEKMGYPKNISKVLGALCCLYRRLPQGASTSPALSNIIAYGMDRKLSALAIEHGWVYSRYADDLTFSGDELTKELVLPRLQAIVEEEKFKLNHKKTRFMGENQRKIITGVSISSGTKLTIPKASKKEIRKNVYFILTRGLEEHQRFIGSQDPVYLKRLLGMLNYWRSIEPDNQYVSDSIKALKHLRGNVG